MMSSSAEGCKNGIKYPRLSSPNRYALRSKGPLPQPQKESPLPQPQKESPLPQPQKESLLPQPQKESPLPQPQEESPLPQPQKESPLPQPKKRSGPRCKYPSHHNHYYQAYKDKPSYQDPENIPILENPDMLELSEIFAEGALSYLSQQGHHFKLFRLDFYEGGVVGGGTRFHHNFLAKPAHDPDAPPETIFSQVFLQRNRPLASSKDLTVECCVSLGPSDSLPKKRDSRGCMFCTKYIHHPKDGCEGIIC